MFEFSYTKSLHAWTVHVVSIGYIYIYILSYNLLYGEFRYSEYKNCMRLEYYAWKVDPIRASILILNQLHMFASVKSGGTLF